MSDVLASLYALAAFAQGLGIGAAGLGVFVACSVWAQAWRPVRREVDRMRAEFEGSRL